MRRVSSRLEPTVSQSGGLCSSPGPLVRYSSRFKEESKFSPSNPSPSCSGPKNCFPITRGSGAVTVSRKPALFITIQVETQVLCGKQPKLSANQNKSDIK